MKEKSFTTKAVHAGRYTPARGVVPPIYQTATYAFETAREMQDIFEGKSEGFVYSRVGNPTQKVFEEKMAVLEGGESAKAFASGMGAINAAVLSIVKSGDHVISDRTIYGSTYDLFTEIFPRLGINVSMIDLSKTDELEENLQDNTKLIFCETPTNPTMKLVDIKKISQYHPTTMVDNTYMTPYLQNPLELGSDVVVHSATKYICGHCDTLGGVIISDAEFIERTHQLLKDFGAAMSPFNAWLLLRGIKTLTLRMDRHTANAEKVADFLEEHPSIAKVYYPGLKDHPQHALAKSQMRGFGGMIAFEMHSYDEAEALMRNLKLCTLAVSLGCVETLIQHPASMTHAAVPKEKRESLGLTDELVRISVGIEDIDDIKSDLSQALD
ncbi:methionine gamma-lyase [Methanosarcinales archaeon ex4572_44]|nr:MAG: methionine gamma-lyase [Methanosarcinales archaeon ex4572_44]HHI30887.1 PLP-dependent transferase [Candidatus Methanoperedenaceae archaeon]